MKVAINVKIGGFHLSYWAMRLLYWKKGETMNSYYSRDSYFYKIYNHNIKGEFFNTYYCHYFNTSVDEFTIGETLSTQNEIVGISPFDFKRDDPDLIEVIEFLGDDTAEDRGSIKIIEIPDGIDWYIDESEEGREWVAEKHRTWGYDRYE